MNKRINRYIAIQVSKITGNTYIHINKFMHTEEGLVNVQISHHDKTGVDLNRIAKVINSIKGQQTTITSDESFFSTLTVINGIFAPISTQEPQAA